MCIRDSMNIIKELETNVDWNRVFGVVDSLYSDEGFTSNADKVFGLVCIPVYSNVGISTARKVEAVVDTIFNKGEAATSVVNT